MRACLFLSCLVFVATASASEPAGSPIALYVKGDSLQQTMLQTRGRLDQWQAARREARKAVKIITWYSTVLGDNETFDPVAVTRKAIDLKAPSQAGPHWKPCPADPSGNPSLTSAKMDYLGTTITATAPVTLTLELSRHERFGGFAYRPPPCGAVPRESADPPRGRHSSRRPGRHPAATGRCPEARPVPARQSPCAG